jgi:hypothetical protein
MADETSTGAPSFSSPFDSVLKSAGSVQVPDIIVPEPIIGTPHHDTSVWPGRQEDINTCAVRCQEFIITQFTGHDPGEDALVREAKEHHWFSGGTKLEDVGNLCELHGIPVTRFQHANIFHLSNELAQGHKVIVGVHADSLWQQHPLIDALLDKLGLTGADHAVVVSGIDTSDPTHVSVIVSDPGNGDAIARYPLEQFTSAWKGSDFFMVATQQPPPEAAHLPEMANFDYGKGHVDHVWGMSYAAFTSLAEHPDQWSDALDEALRHVDGAAWTHDEHHTADHGAVAPTVDHDDPQLDWHHAEAVADHGRDAPGHDLHVPLTDMGAAHSDPPDHQGVADDFHIHDSSIA